MTEVLVDRPRPDVTDMLAVHQVFRDALAQAPALVGGADPADPERVAMVSTYYANVLAFLHVHHSGEDAVLWPVLLGRVGDDAELVQTIASQHEEVEVAVSRATTLLETWSTTPDVALGGALVDALTALREVLVAHLDQEEQHVLPLCAEHVTVEEWGALPAHGMAHFGGDKIWLLLGLLRTRMTQAQRDAMLAHMPPPVVEFWTNVGEPEYTRFMAQLGV